VAWQRLAFTTLGFVLVCSWIVVQASTWTPAALHHPLWQWMRDTFKVDNPGSITVNRTETFSRCCGY
jgi:hypothetical protein